MNLRIAGVAACLGALAALAQPPKLEFEAASVRASGPVPRSAAGRIMGGPGTSDPERIVFSHVTMSRLLKTAFDVPLDQISGPGWALAPNTDSALRFEVEAKVPPGATGSQVNEMLKTLLIERFRITLHPQPKTFDAYNLVLATGGSRLKPAEQPTGSADVNRSGRIPVGEDGFPQVPPGFGRIVTAGDADGQARLTARMVTMPAIVAMIQLAAGNPHVFDKTGLTGTYDFRLSRALPGSGAVASDPAPDLFTAIEKQLGLKLEKIKVPLDVIVIDHIEQVPAEP